MYSVVCKKTGKVLAKNLTLDGVDTLGIKTRVELRKHSDRRNDHLCD